MHLRFTCNTSYAINSRSCILVQKGENFQEISVLIYHSSVKNINVPTYLVISKQQIASCLINVTMEFKHIGKGSPNSDILSLHAVHITHI